MVKNENIQKITFLLILGILAFSLIHFAYAVCSGGSSCGGGTVPGPGIQCSDSDANTTFPEGRNYFVKGLCKDYSDPDGTRLHREDTCNGLAYVNEWYCYQCTEPSCTGIPKYPCTYGCDNGHCMTYDEFIQHFNLQIPDTNVFCIDGDGPNYPDLPVLTQPNCDDSSNGRNNFSEDSFCIDSSGVYFDRCDGGAVDYYCSNGGFCMASDDPCENGCFQGKCNPVLPKKGLCLNPNSDVCTESFDNICCPKEDSVYLLDNGPKDYQDCIKNFFVSGDLNALQKEKCEMVCCCELYYDDENTKQVDASEKYRLSCSGQDRTIYSGKEGCSKETCSEDFKYLPDTINTFENRWLNNIQKGRGCKAGQCTDGLFCLIDLKDTEEKICCEQGDCVEEGVCVLNQTNATAYGKEYICQNSKWILISKPDENKGSGCAFMPMPSKNPPFDFALFGIILYLSAMSLIKIGSFITVWSNKDV